MKPYHKWLLAASPKNAVVRMKNRSISVETFTSYRKSPSAKLTSLLNAAVLYVNLKHKATAQRQPRSEERGYAAARALNTERLAWR